MTSNNYQPKPEHKFTFGLWTVGNRGRDPFGDATRPTLSPVKIIKELSRLGAYGVNLHDNDLVPIDATPPERGRIVDEFKKALADHGMKAPMMTTNLFFLVKLLEESYEGPRHFDAHSYRNEDEAGVWDFAAGCMRNYLILKDKARLFNEDAEIQSLLSEIHSASAEDRKPLGSYTRAKADEIKSLSVDRIELAKKKLPYERLDQLTVDILLGVR